jgi:FKBP-type peptidyl-prolyl cis-trans isomerase
MNFSALALVTALLFQGGKVEIKDIAPGTGRAAQANDLVTVEFTGTLLDGRQVDTSTGKPPLAFTLGKKEMIPGWDIGIVGMKVGGERELIIPPDLAYGDTGAGEVVPPKSTLKFSIKLLHIDRPGDAAAIEKTVIKEGTGDAPVEGDAMDVHYLGTFLNGVKFDSTYDRQTPMRVLQGHFRLIKGFIQGLEGMKLGEKRKIVIPPVIGYGANPRGAIPGNSTLCFELELVKVTPKAEVLKQIETDKKKLKIEEIAPGSGPEIHNGDVVSLHFSMALAGGKKLGDTRDSSQPRTYQVGSGQITRGFDVALIGMKAGGKRKVTIPAELGYGATVSGNGTIPANSTLILELEIVKISP